MKAQVWYNVNLKAYEATVATAGRPFKTNVKDRSNSKKTFVTGATREEALLNLHASV